MTKLIIQILTKLAIMWFTKALEKLQNANSETEKLYDGIDREFLGFVNNKRNDNYQKYIKTLNTPKKELPLKPDRTLNQYEYYSELQHDKKDDDE